MKLLRRREATQWEMLLSWAHSEAVNGKPGMAQTPVAQSVFPKLEARAELTDEEETRLVGSLLLARSILLGYFMRTPTTWYHGSVALKDLRDLHTIQTFASYAPATRRLGELALRPVTPPGLSVPDFDLKKMVGSPVAVTDDLDGDWCLLDGYNRCVELIAMHEQGEPPAQRIDMFVGVAPRARRWQNW